MYEVDVSEILALEAELQNQAEARIKEGARIIVRKSTLDTQAGGQARSPVDTGFNRSSITSTFRGNAAEFSGETGPTSEYGDFLERGTSRMAPRPYMFPSADITEPKFFEAADKLAEVILP